MNPRLCPTPSVSARLLIVAVFALGGTALGQDEPPPVSPEWAARWRADLAFVTDSLPNVHADLFHSIGRDRFAAEIDSLAVRVPGLAHHEIATELARIVALVGDGHTRLTLPFDSGARFFTGHSRTAPPRVPGLVFRHLPIRFHLFADGLYVTRASTDLAHVVGSRVVRIGRLDVDAAMAAVAPTVHHDNAQQLSDLVANWLVVPEILHARGVIAAPGRVAIEVETQTGERETVTLEPVPLGERVAWRDARPGDRTLLQHREPARRHWFTPLPGGRTVYARYREVLDDDDQTIAEFAEQLFRYLREHATERVVLDIRGNVGGNGFLNGPIVRGLIRAEPLWGPGGLFVLIDRGTFSAAVMLAVDLEHRTPAILVGEPTGGTPNGYGDSRRVRLPETGLTIRASTLYWQLSDPRDERDAVTPHVSVAPRFADYRDGRDPALDTVLAMVQEVGDPAGAWKGTVGLEYQRLPLQLRLAREPAGWSGVITLPALGANALTLEQVEELQGEIRFSFRVGGVNARARIRTGSAAMTGTLDVAGSVLPIVLWRAGQGRASGRE